MTKTGVVGGLRSATTHRANDLVVRRAYRPNRRRGHLLPGARRVAPGRPGSAGPVTQATCAPTALSAHSAHCWIHLSVGPALFLQPPPQDRSIAYTDPQLPRQRSPQPAPRVHQCQLRFPTKDHVLGHTEHRLLSTPQARPAPLLQYNPDPQGLAVAAAHRRSDLKFSTFAVGSEAGRPPTDLLPYGGNTVSSCRRTPPIARAHQPAFGFRIPSAPLGPGQSLHPIGRRAQQANCQSS